MTWLCYYFRARAACGTDETVDSPFDIQAECTDCRKNVSSTVCVRR